MLFTVGVGKFFSVKNGKYFTIHTPMAFVTTIQLFSKVALSHPLQQPQSLQHALQAAAHSHTSLPETALPPASKKKTITDIVSFSVPIFLKMNSLTLCWPS